MEPVLLLRVLPGPGRHPAGLALDPDQGPQGGGGPVAQLPPRGEEVADQLAAETLAGDMSVFILAPFRGFSNILVAASLAPPASSGQSVASSQPLLTLAVVSTTITSLLPGCSTSTDSVLVFLQPSPPSN